MVTEIWKGEPSPGPSSVTAVPKTYARDLSLLDAIDSLTFCIHSSNFRRRSRWLQFGSFDALLSRRSPDGERFATVREFRDS